MNPFMLGIVTAVILSLIRYFAFDRKEDKEVAVMAKKSYQRDYQQLLETRTERTLNVQIMSEDTFWSLIDTTKKKSKENFKYQVGLLKDLFQTMTAEQLLEFQGRLVKESLRANTHKMAGAFVIINHSMTFQDFEHFKEWLISRGQLHFNNFIENPEYIRNSKMAGLDSNGIYMALTAAYYEKTQRLIPDFAEISFGFEDEKILEKDLSTKFPELWKKFIVAVD